VLRGYAAAGRPEPVAVSSLSAEKMFQDLHEELVSLHRVVTGAELLSGLPAAESVEHVMARLRDLLGRAWSAR